MKSSFDFVSLFSPVKTPRAQLINVLLAHGFTPRGRFYVQKDDAPDSLQVEVVVNSRPGDEVDKASLGSSALVRRCRTGREGAPLAERLALRLGFGTHALLGFRTASGRMVQAHLNAVRAIQGRLHAIAYDGWVFQESGGVTVLDLRSRHVERLSPFFLVAGYASGTKPGKPPPGYSLSQACSSPERVPLIAHLAQAQLARLPLLFRSRSTSVAARAVMEAHERCRNYYLLMPEAGQIDDPSAVVRRTFSHAEIVLDEFAWYDARGAYLLSRFPGV